VYVLTTNRKQSTYADILSKLVELEPDFKPPRAMVDFELAAINAINQQFEGVIVSGCFFSFYAKPLETYSIVWPSNTLQFRC
jgi:hypothetical protein